MSRSQALVLFPDGTIRRGLYHNTSDLMSPRLEYDDHESCDLSVAHDVCIWVDEQFWTARATHTHIVDGCSPWGAEDMHGRPIAGRKEPDLRRGTPEWVKKYFDAHADR